MPGARLARHKALAGPPPAETGKVYLAGLKKSRKILVPGARLELAQEFNFPTDFKSVASADSAIRA